jgi:quinol-cytochrome oxidoreductase complex cytochrome b subunit
MMVHKFIFVIDTNESISSCQFLVELLLGRDMVIAHLTLLRVGALHTCHVRILIVIVLGIHRIVV